MQLISGMSKSGYWISNMVADILKVYLPILAIIGLTAVFKVDYSGMNELMLLFPPAIVLWCYVMTFLFQSETSA
jgi:K+ transporter